MLEMDLGILVQSPAQACQTIQSLVEARPLSRFRARLASPKLINKPLTISGTAFLHSAAASVPSEQQARLEHNVLGVLTWSFRRNPRWQQGPLSTLSPSSGDQAYVARHEALLGDRSAGFSMSSGRGRMPAMIQRPVSPCRCQYPCCILECFILFKGGKATSAPG